MDGVLKELQQTVCEIWRACLEPRTTSQVTMKDGFGPRQASCKGPPTLQAGGLPVGEQRGDGPERAGRPGDSHPRDGKIAVQNQ